MGEDRFDDMGDFLEDLLRKLASELDAMEVEPEVVPVRARFVAVRGDEQLDITVNALQLVTLPFVQTGVACLTIDGEHGHVPLQVYADMLAAADVVVGLN
jgi:hypothetical protein